MKIDFGTRPPPGRFERPIIDMTPDGRFAGPPSTPVASQLFRYAVVLAVIAGAGAVAALLLWLAFLLIPIAIGAALIAYVAFRWQLWRRRGAFNLMRR